MSFIISSVPAQPGIYYHSPRTWCVAVHSKLGMPDFLHVATEKKQKTTLERFLCLHQYAWLYLLIKRLDEDHRTLIILSLSDRAENCTFSYNSCWAGNRDIYPAFAVHKHQVLDKIPTIRCLCFGFTLKFHTLSRYFHIT